MAPDNATVCILGAGPHGLAAATHLLTARPSLADELVVIDPSGTWLSRWHEQFARLGIDTLRSPSVHHPGTVPEGLGAYAAHLGLPRSGLPYDPPLTSVFASYCARLVETFDLPEPVATRPRHVSFADGRLVIDTDTGTISALRLVLATNPHRRVIPSWVWDLLGKVPHLVSHSDDIDLREPEPPGTSIAIVGGGLTAAHLACGAAEHGHQVTLVSRRPLELRNFDTDPGWLGPKHLRDFESEPDPAVRLGMARAARGGGTIPPWMHTRLVELAEAGRLRLVEGREVTSAEVGAPSGALLRLDDDSTLEAERVWLATGTVADLGAAHALQPLSDDIATVDGIPVADAELRVGPFPLHVMGRLATMALGPAAGNLWGAQRAARRIARAVTGVELDLDGVARLSNCRPNHML